MNLDPTLLDILVCPQCRTAPFVDNDADELVCNTCQLAYPVRNNIPILTIVLNNLASSTAIRLTLALV